MKINLPKEYWKIQVPPPPISYKSNPNLDKTPTDKLDSMNVDIKTQTGERDIKMVEIYVPLFRTGRPEYVGIYCPLIPDGSDQPKNKYHFPAKCRKGIKKQIRNTAWRSISI